MSYFTPMSGLLGGSLVGLSAATLLLFNGDILGASGIVSTTILFPRKTLKEAHWKYAFLGSFLVTSVLYADYINTGVLNDPRQAQDVTIPFLSKAAYAIAGFFVGIGTRLGNGCTSGHGISGLARFSKRSLVAVATFMTTGILTAYLVSPVRSWATQTQFLRDDSGTKAPVRSSWGGIITLLFVLAALVPTKKTPSKEKDETVSKDQDINLQRKNGPAAVAGALFALGLAKSGMVLFSKVFGFLDVSAIARGTYDPTLMTVMGSGVVVSWLSYQYVAGYNMVENPKALSCPLALKSSCGKFNVPTNKTIDAQLVGGEALFGVGWAIGGLCPGPAIFQAGAGVPNIVGFWWPAFILGSFLGQKIKENLAARK